jgi:hypothetical protein
MPQPDPHERSKAFKLLICFGAILTFALISVLFLELLFPASVHDNHDHWLYGNLDNSRYHPDDECREPSDCDDGDPCTQESCSFPEGPSYCGHQYPVLDHHTCWILGCQNGDHYPEFMLPDGTPCETITRVLPDKHHKIMELRIGYCQQGECTPVPDSTCDDYNPCTTDKILSNAPEICHGPNGPYRCDFNKIDLGGDDYMFITQIYHQISLKCENKAIQDTTLCKDHTYGVNGRCIKGVCVGGSL